MNTFALVGIVAYVAIQFVIGAWVSRNMASDEDYIVASRSLGMGLVAFSVFATWFGAEAIVASTGEIYANGLSSGLVDPFGYGFAVVIVGLVLAAPLWRRGVMTYADMIRARYSPAVEKLFVLILLPGSLFWAGAQIRSFGQILGSATGLDLTTAILIAAFLVAVYTIVGGLLADAVTDVIQGLAVIVGLVALAVAVMAASGGFAESLARVEPARLDVLGGSDGALAKLEKLAIVICGSMVAIELVSRFLGARSASIAAGATIVGGVLYLIVGFAPLYLGLVGPSLIKGLEETEQIVPRLAEIYLPGAAYALFIGALVSAILSVVHAALHAPAAQLSHNIVFRALPSLSPRARLNGVRLCVLAVSVVATAMALSVGRIKELVELASSFGSAGAFVVAMLGLFTRFGGPWAATAALLAGAIVWLVARFVLALPSPFLTGLAAAFLGYVVLALVERRAAMAPRT
jgi:Na+/proline symporter